jgi:hypothetical protein
MALLPSYIPPVVFTACHPGYLAAFVLPVCFAGRTPWGASGACAGELPPSKISPPYAPFLPNNLPKIIPSLYWKQP